jgi:hypothetical protein
MWKNVGRPARGHCRDTHRCIHPRPPTRPVRQVGILPRENLRAARRRQGIADVLPVRDPRRSLQVFPAQFGHFDQLALVPELGGQSDVHPHGVVAAATGAPVHPEGVRSLADGPTPPGGASLTRRRRRRRAAASVVGRRTADAAAHFAVPVLCGFWRICVQPHCRLRDGAGLAPHDRLSHLPTSLLLAHIRSTDPIVPALLFVTPLTIKLYSQGLRWVSEMPPPSVSGLAVWSRFYRRPREEPSLRLIHGDVSRLTIATPVLCAAGGRLQCGIPNLLSANGISRTAARITMGEWQSFTPSLWVFRMCS